MINELKFDTENLFYLTTINFYTNERGCTLGYKMSKKDDTYLMCAENSGYHRLCGDYIPIVFSIADSVPFSEVTGKSGILSLDDVLNEDKNVVKKLNANGIFEYYYITDKEKTFAIIKPDGMPNIDKIIEMIYNSGLKIEKYEVRQLDEEILREHYSHLVDKKFYPSLQEYMMSAPVALMVLSGDCAVDRLRNLMGPTDSSKAPSDTIRGKFGTDIQKNAIHGSDSKENAAIEINRFFKEKTKKLNKI